MFYSYEVFCVILYIKVETNCKNFLSIFKKLYFIETKTKIFLQMYSLVLTTFS